MLVLHAARVYGHVTLLYTARLAVRDGCHHLHTQINSYFLASCHGDAEHVPFVGRAACKETRFDVYVL